MYSKELLKGTIGVMVLKLLEENEKMYGYEISQRVKELTDGKILLKDGSLYPALHKLLNDGILGYEEQSIGKRVRKYYFLTKKGKKEKDTQMAELKDFLETIQKVIFNDLNSMPAI
ncbi:PadR family transcriptional regulator [Marinoscillum sp.]|uniref:PadR family transcriptional regulator n=1 Tax=Marinoscillum sp. TaxID=2024838 RepID=UPI003BAC9272